MLAIIFLFWLDIFIFDCIFRLWGHLFRRFSLLPTECCSSWTNITFRVLFASSFVFRTSLAWPTFNRFHFSAHFNTRQRLDATFCRRFWRQKLFLSQFVFSLSSGRFASIFWSKHPDWHHFMCVFSVELSSFSAYCVCWHVHDGRQSDSESFATLGCFASLHTRTQGQTHAFHSSLR